MKNNIFVLLLLLLPVLTYAQDETSPKTENKVIFVEFGGNSIIYSLGFDTRFNKNKKDGIGMSVGLGLQTHDVVTRWKDSEGFLSWPEPAETKKALVYLAPIKLNYLLAVNEKKTHLFEFGLGININNLKKGTGLLGLPEWDNRPNIAYTGTIAYRYQPNRSSFFLRTGIHPMAHKKLDMPSLYPGLSLGFTF